MKPFSPLSSCGHPSQRVKIQKIIQSKMRTTSLLLCKYGNYICLIQSVHDDELSQVDAKLITILNEIFLLDRWYFWKESVRHRPQPRLLPLVSHCVLGRLGWDLSLRPPRSSSHRKRLLQLNCHHSLK